MSALRRRTAMTIACLTAATACAGASAPATRATTASSAAASACPGVAPHSQVVLYSVPGLEYWYQDTVAAFQNDCAATVAYVGLPPDQLVERLRTERSSPLADVVVLPAVEMATAVADGLISDSPVPADGVPDDRCEAARRWCALGESYISWITAAPSASRPTTFEDLLDTGRGTVRYAGPGQNDAGTAFMLLLDRTIGADATDRFLRDLETRVGTHEANTDAASRAVSDGSAWTANGDLQEHLNDLVQFPKLTIWFPRPAAAAAPSTIAIPVAAAVAAGSTRSDAAGALLRSLWSTRAQASIGTANLTPGRADARTTGTRAQQFADTLAGVQVERVDWQQVVADLPAMRARWDQLRSAPLSNTPSNVPSAPPPTTGGP